MTTYPNWFRQVGADRNFQKYLGAHPRAIHRALQIGAFTGDASMWLVEHTSALVLHDVDTWQGSDEEEHNAFDWNDVEATYDERTAGYGRIHKHKMTSDEFFDTEPAPFDFIYIDGGHEAVQVMNDGLNAAEYINPGGIIAFDDYTWGLHLPKWQRPHDAINSFLTLFDGKYRLLEKDLQVWVRWL